MSSFSPRGFYHAVGKKKFLEFILLAVFLLFFYLPILNLVMLAFGERYEAPAVFPQQWGTKWWTFVLTQPDLIRAIVLSLVFAIVTTLISMLICLPAAYAIARFEFVGRRFAQLSLGITILFVTHDQEEAMAISDRIVVMNKGSIEQVGTPVEVYDHPVSRYVAAFIGDMNFFTGANEITAVRPEDVHLATEGEAGDITGQITVIMVLGHYVSITVEAEGQSVKLFLPRAQASHLKVRDQVRLSFGRKTTYPTA